METLHKCILCGKEKSKTEFCGITKSFKCKACLGVQEAKRCSKCKTIKPLTAFGNDKNTKSGLASHCKQCRSEYKKKKYICMVCGKAKTSICFESLNYLKCTLCSR